MADNGIKAGEVVEVLVSVIMPAWNCAGTIGKAIDSVLVQDVPLELIVVNDTSPDDLDAVMKTYASDPRVRYVKNEHNLGASGSRNRGVALAKGSYVAFLDADDWWEKGKLKKQLQLLTAHAGGAVFDGQRTADAGWQADRQSHRRTGGDHLPEAFTSQLY